MTNAFGLELASAIAALYYDGTDVTAPTQVYVKLHSADPGSDGTANELDSAAGAAGYQPLAVSIPADFGQGADPTQITNANRIEDFGPAQENWPEVTHYSIWTTSDQTGECQYEDALSSPKTVTDGDPVVIAAGNLDIDILE